MPEPDRRIKREAFAAAERFLADESDESLLRHAALELRWAIEALVYEKLWAYRSYLPAESRKWQPPQAIKTLLKIDPNADRTSRLSFAFQEQDGEPAAGPFHHAGTDHRPEKKWLTTTWNKLGSALHAPYPFAQGEPDAAAWRAFMREVLAELKPMVERSFTSVFVPRVHTANCLFCGTKMVATDSSLEAFGLMECPAANCEGQHQLDGPVQDDCRLIPVETAAECCACGETFRFSRAMLRRGGTADCLHCGARHTIVEAFDIQLREPQPDGEPETR
jgi:hypothetical protein